MKTSLLSVAAAAGISLVAGAASATTISVSVFDINTFNQAVSGPSFVTEDFESGFAVGEITGNGGNAGATLDTVVGTFSSLGGVGSGSTCALSTGGSNGICDTLAIFDSSINSQNNTVPLDGEYSLNSNDTFGIQWDVGTGDLFNRVVFGMSDATDQGATLTITADDGTTSVFEVLNPNLGDGNAQLVIIDFDELIGSATISLESSIEDDGFAIDGVSVGVVPLPAAGLLLIGGLGVLGAMRRRQKS
ncbi:MAG: VPLPA-CTERM sorting domain-containing protein [Pseudomonadota bacterium]